MKIAAKRPVGRPRIDIRPRRRTAPQEILVVAARLFAARGYEGTSTREIAKAAGLRQAGIFHYYPRKIDILIALAERVVLPAVDLLDAIAGQPGPGAEKLYRFLYMDILHLCDQPYDVAAVATLREGRGPRFRRFWVARGKMVDTIEGWIRQGISARDLEADDPKLAARVVFGTLEATFSWYKPSREPPPRAVARAVASQTLRGLLRDPARLAEVRDRAEQ